MVMLLDSDAGDFEKRFSDLLAAKREVSEDVDAAVRAIIDDVRARGDDALVELTQRFDHMDLGECGITVDEKEIDAAVAQVDADTYKALRYVHLSTHLKTPSILTPFQIETYNKLRGYSSEDPCKNIPKGHDPEMWKKHHNCP